MDIISAILLAYLLGAIPFAFILGKVLKGIDLRKVGSGNIGATNLVRAAGFKIGVFGLILDVLKGVIPVIVIADLIKTNYGLSRDSLRLILGIASISGHNWTIFLNFKGGKGIATTLGVLIGLAIKNIIILKITFMLALIWGVSFISIGYVSLASIISAFFLPIFLYIFKLNKDFIIFGIVMTIFAILRHKPNIYRLLQHKEQHFNIKSKFPFLKKKALP